MIGCIQDCGKPFYTGNYIAFASALRMVHPHMRLIANCDMGAFPSQPQPAIHVHRQHLAYAARAGQFWL